MMQGWLPPTFIKIDTWYLAIHLNDLYEAAILMVRRMAKFRNITFPMILAVAAPTLSSVLQLQQLLYHTSLMMAVLAPLVVVQVRLTSSHGFIV